MPRIEAVAQPAHQLPHTLAVRAEVAQRPAQRPGCPLQRHRDLPRRGRATQRAQPLDRRVAGPADHAGAGARADQAFIQIVREEVDRIVHPVAQHAEPKRDGPAETAARHQAPERGRAIGGSGCQARSPWLLSRRASAWTAASVPAKRAARVQSGSAASAGESSSSAPGRSPRLEQVARGGGERVARAAGDDGHVGAGQRAEPEVDLGDDAEPAEPADLELGEVVARPRSSPPARPPAPAARRRWRRCSRARGPAPDRSRGAADPRWRSRRPSRDCARAARADRARATSPRRPDGGAATPSACPPPPSRPGRRGSPTPPGRVRGCSARGRPARRRRARCRGLRPGSSSPPRAPAGRPATRPRRCPAWRAGRPAASRSTPAVPSSARSRP